MSTEREKELLNQIEPLQAELQEIRDQRHRQEQARYIGRYFKFNNGYDAERRWWLYAKVTHLNDRWPAGITFQSTVDGNREIKEEPYLTGLGGVGWAEIDADEFAQAWRDLMVDVDRIGALVLTEV